MSTVVDEAVLEKFRALPREKQQEVLDSIEFLHQRGQAPGARTPAKGLGANLGVRLTEQDIAEARREMWGAAT